MSDALEQLRREIDLPAGEAPSLADLPDEMVRELVQAVREARERHEREIQASLERTLEHVPRLLRGRARKMLGIRS